jgi:hypothetical protein
MDRDDCGKRLAFQTEASSGGRAWARASDAPCTMSKAARATCLQRLKTGFAFKTPMPSSPTDQFRKDPSIPKEKHHGYGRFSNLAAKR